MYDDYSPWFFLLMRAPEKSSANLLRNKKLKTQITKPMQKHIRMKDLPSLVLNKLVCCLLFCAMTLLTSFITYPSIAGESYSIILNNLHQVSENEIEFDLILHNTGSPFFINDIQVEINIDQNIIPINGFICPKEITVVEGSSELLYFPEEVSISADLTRIVLFTEKPFNNQQVQVINHDKKLTIGKIRLVAAYKQARGVFNNIIPSFYVDDYGTLVQKCNVNENNQKQEIGEVVPNSQLITEMPILPLSNFVFTGIGYWHSNDDGKYNHWNNHPKTHSDFSNKLPDKHSNVKIAGVSFIEKGKEVKILADQTGKGGIIRVIQPEDPMFLLNLQTTCSQSALMLFDDEFAPIDIPSYLLTGTVVYLGAYHNAECGEFLNWTDQHGHEIASEAEFGPYVMPAMDMTITANWSVDDMDKNAKNGLLTLQKQKSGETGLVIEPGGALTAKNIHNENFSSSAITLQSTAPDDIPGSLILYNGGVGATVERYIKRRNEENAQWGWHMLAAPVAGMPIRPEFVPEGSIPSWVDFYKWDESHVAVVDGMPEYGWWINTRIAGGDWNEAFEDEFVPGRGYLLAYGDPDKAYGDKAHRFTGELRTTALVVEGLTRAPGGEYAGWHLLGNPFASAIDWNAGDWQRQNILGGPKIWDSQWSSYYPVVDIIPAMSGFMVHTDGNGALRIPPEARVHQAAPTAYADDSQPQRSAHWHPATASHKYNHHLISLQAIDPLGHTGQKTVILFRDEASDGYDPLYDTPFMAGHAPHFWSMPPNQGNPNPNNLSPRLALNNLPFPDKPIAIPMGFRKNDAQSFRIEPVHNNTPHSLFLEDTQAERIHPLKPDMPYLFSASENDPEQRFFLHLTDGQPPTPIGAQDQLPHISANRSHLFVHTRCAPCTLDIHNLRGMQLMHTTLPHQGEHQLAHQLPPGIYIARVKCGSITTVVKVLI